ncbi:MAG: hypothetical protein IK113_08200 [Bacteroidales bacterium]|nr:hypothetical protein [Bacteroidales bacterium]
MKPGKVIRNVLIAVIGLLLAVLVALQIILRPAVLTKLVNKFAADYVEGDVSFGNIKAHVIKSFPFLNLEADDFSLTYPHERYAQWDTIYPDSGRRFSLMKAGRGEEVDTLASFRHLSVSLNYMGIIRGNGFHIRKAELTHPRIFAHYYDSSAANWDILPIGGPKKDTTKKPAPRIEIDKVHMSDRPFIVFTNPRDTIHGMFSMRRLNLDGHMDTREIDRMESALEIDSLFVSGRLPADTVAVALQSLRAKGRDRHLELDAKAQAWLATGSHGRLRVPLGISLDGNLPERQDDSLEVTLNRLGLDVSALHLDGKGSVTAGKGAYNLDLEASIDKCPLGKLIDEYQDNFPALKKIDTDARLNVNALIKGVLGGGRMPSIDADITIPPAMLDYEGVGRKGQLALDAKVTTDDLKAVDADIRNLFLDIVGAKIDLEGGVKDVLGEDPLIVFDGTARARVDSLTRAFTSERGISGTGSIDAKLHGKVRKSQLNMVKIGGADILCNLDARDLSIQDAPDSIDALIPALELELATKANKIDRNIRQGARVLALKARTDTLSAKYGNLDIKGGKLLLLMQNSADILKRGKELTPLMGLLKLGSLGLRDQEGMGIRLRENTETFRITPASKSQPSPRLSLSSSSGRLGFRKGTDFYAMKDVKFDVSAIKHISRRMDTERRNHILDSLQRVYPGVPRDSLFRKARLDRMNRMPKDDFASKDIKISLSKALQGYVKDWDINGNLDIGGGRVMMPKFPLKTQVSAIKGSFDNDTLDLKNITINAGESDLSARAHLTGLRRALIGRGKSKLKLKADVSSNFLEVNELMRSYAYSTTYEPPQKLADASDEAVQEAVESAELPDSTGGKLIVIPSNLDVDFTLEASGIKYDSLLISWAAADIAMRDRTLQVTNAIAASNMGDLYFEGFYATRNKKDISAGFDLNLVNITAEKVITLFPAVDTLMPMLTSFDGDLDCELAATTQIDTNMNLVIPSVDGILKISGNDLNLKDSKDFTKIAKLLMFRDKKKAHIDNMSVTGMMRDNRIDIFPFVLDVDRYRVAASGVQLVNEWLDYHISVIKSPLLFKFGLNAWGKDFDHIKYGLSKARYLNANVPVFTKQMDTVQYSLIAAIHNIFELGVEKALAENRAAEYLQQQEISAKGHESSEEVSVEDLENAAEGMAGFQEGILGNVESRREAIKQEILRLEKELSEANEQ